MSGKLKVRQVKSQIGGNQSQRETLRSLGLRRIGHEVIKEDRPEIRGMVQTVAHLVTVEAISAAEAEDVQPRRPKNQ
ncbi:50S ribosomal protein L30 [Jiangella asiatica]|uniref:Large ribosomal subunit protein uL30 n=1 Tax=Jiangella asiatica TaxID=2530372 RepID=A0A4R5CNE9_9ACTN|nr:50S ribosomal protein L30 [Jiangella asiatica]TDE00877.1 50S ribosomal protein L30 [Jiangella asiatica]